LKAIVFGYELRVRQFPPEGQHLPKLRQLRRQFEILDAVAADIDQTPHPQIRCAQIDRIPLVRPPWDEDGSIDVVVFNKPWMAFWQTISRGPVRVTVTIESASDRYEFKDVDSTKRVFTCSVFRAISIYADRDDI